MTDRLGPGAHIAFEGQVPTHNVGGGAQPLTQAQEVQKRKEWDRAAKTWGSSTCMTPFPVSCFPTSVS